MVDGAALRVPGTKKKKIVFRAMEFTAKDKDFSIVKKGWVQWAKKKEKKKP